MLNNIKNETKETKESKLEAVSIRPEGKGKYILLFQFTNFEFHSIEFNKNESKEIVMIKMNEILLKMLLVNKNKLEKNESK